MQGKDEYRAYDSFLSARPVPQLPIFYSCSSVAQICSSQQRLCQRTDADLGWTAIWILYA